MRCSELLWASHPYGDLGGGFWVVALLGETVVWFNDIEDGFNRSHFCRFYPSIHVIMNRHDKKVGKAHKNVAY